MKTKAYTVEKFTIVGRTANTDSTDDSFVDWVEVDVLPDAGAEDDRAALAVAEMRKKPERSDDNTIIVVAVFRGHHFDLNPR